MSSLDDYVISSIMSLAPNILRASDLCLLTRCNTNADQDATSHGISAAALAVAAQHRYVPDMISVSRKLLETAVAIRSDTRASETTRIPLAVVRYRNRHPGMCDNILKRVAVPRGKCSCLSLHEPDERIPTSTTRMYAQLPSGLV